jgi:hypothetical protein
MWILISSKSPDGTALMIEEFTAGLSARCRQQSSEHQRLRILARCRRHVIQKASRFSEHLGHELAKLLLLVREKIRGCQRDEFAVLFLMPLCRGFAHFVTVRVSRREGGNKSMSAQMPRRRKAEMRLAQERFRSMQRIQPFLTAILTRTPFSAGD